MRRKQTRARSSADARAILGAVRRPSVIPWLLGIVMLVPLLAGCAVTAPDETSESPEALPTGLVGPVAPTVGPGALRYVVLGDSYSFGDGVKQSDRWPNQLVRILRPDLDLDIVANLAGRSSASRQVIQDQLPQLVELEPQFVSVQVGVNDVILRTPAETYSANMAHILDTVLTLVDADRVVVVTTPDYTLMPDGDIYGEPEVKSARIREFNDLLRAAAEARGIAVVDISPISDRVQQDPSLVAVPVDGRDLHPSGKQYAGWADLVAEAVRPLFHEAPPSRDASDAAGAPLRLVTAPSPAAPDAPGSSVSP